MGISQQAASRWLRELQGERLVEKPAGTYVATAAGQAYISSISTTPTAAIEGKVFSGLGEGKYYLSQKGYADQIRQKLGFRPYQGTLNIRLSDVASIASNRLLRAKPGIVLEGFKKAERAFGRVRCYPCRINGRVGGAAIVPERAHYADDVVEILAPVFLRKALSLKDGSAVKLKPAKGPSR